ncbi:MAG TPA: hypothetical protein VD861_05170 [Pyrinomonadaceae bacterium]|nr:hypothetical protein [Pyrinomonadaceae bacterium]
MYELNKRYYAFINGTHLDFEVSRAKVSSRSRAHVFQVDVALRGVSGPVHGSDLRVNLLDATFTPLNKLTHNLDFVNLPSFTWHGSTSIFKSEQFGEARVPPAYLSLQLFGHREIFALTLKTEEKVPGTTPDTPPPVEPPRPPPRPQPSGKKCCPDTFITPTGALPTLVRKVPNTVAVMIICKPWVIEATFNDAPPPCICNCCEYRQFVKGTMTVTAPGGTPTFDISPITDYKEPDKLPGQPPPKPIPVKGLNPETFVEDTIGDPARPGNPFKFGYRNDLEIRPGRKLDVVQDYPTPCSYWALDTPGGEKRAGGTYNIDVTFKGQIVDICNNEAIVAGPNIWTWTFKGIA